MLFKIRPNSVPNHKLEAPGLDLFFSAFNAWMKDCAENPSRALDQQMSFWKETAQNYFKAQENLYSAMSGGWGNQDNDPHTNSRSKDRRFQNPHWESNPWLQFIRDQYLTTSQATAELVASLDGLGEQDKTRLEFFSRRRKPEAQATSDSM